jgi:hypothetical protein
MRKLILVTAIAMMSTTSCYANLSLASSEPASTAVEQAKVDQSTSPKPVTSTKSLPAKPHKRHSAPIAAYRVYQVHSYSYGHCL